MKANSVNWHATAGSVLVSALVLSSGLLCVLPRAQAAAAVKVHCKGESVFIPGWSDGSMTLTYDGSAAGTLSVVGPHIQFSVPATLSESTTKTEGQTYSETLIYGGAEITTVMPELAEVDACVAGKLPPEERKDADIYLNAALSCFGKAPTSRTPVPVRASVKLGFASGDSGARVEMTITYAARSASPDGAMSIDLMPRDCRLAP